MNWTLTSKLTPKSPPPQLVGDREGTIRGGFTVNIGKFFHHY